MLMATAQHSFLMLSSQHAGPSGKAVGAASVACTSPNTGRTLCHRRRPEVDRVRVLPAGQVHQGLQVQVQPRPQRGAQGRQDRPVHRPVRGLTILRITDQELRPVWTHVAHAGHIVCITHRVCMTRQLHYMHADARRAWLTGHAAWLQAQLQCAANHPDSITATLFNIIAGGRRTTMTTWRTGTRSSWRR